MIYTINDSSNRTDKYCHTIPTQMTSEMLNKLNSFIFFLFPEFDMSIYTGCDNEICSTKVIHNNSTSDSQAIMHKKLLVC